MFGRISSLAKAVGAALALCLLAGCAEQRVDSGLPEGWPSKLIFAYYVDDEVPGLRYEATSAISDYLTRKLGVPVTLRKSTQYGPIIEALRSGKVDLSMLGTFAYILAAEKANAECIVARREEDGPVSYHSIIFTRAGSDVASFEDLKRRAKKLSFAFTNPASTSGHLIPRAFLENEGVFAERDFGDLIFPGKHNATLLAVLSGQIDVGCVSENTFRKLVSLDRVDPKEVRILWKSPAIPSGCIAVRGGLPPDLKRKVQEALVSLRSEEPDTWEDVRKIYQFSSNPDAYFYASNDAEYDPVRALANRLNHVSWKN